MNKTLVISIIIFFVCLGCKSSIGQNNTNISILTGAEQINTYLPYLNEKRIAIVANQTSVLGTTHLIDTLFSLEIDVRTIFAPEHGFKGNYAAGIEVGDDSLSIPDVDIVSLYGTKSIPSKEDLSDIDVVIFDIQDVGCRFYT